MNFTNLQQKRVEKLKDAFIFKIDKRFENYQESEDSFCFDYNDNVLVEVTFSASTEYSGGHKYESDPTLQPEVKISIDNVVIDGIYNKFGENMPNITNLLNYMF